MVASDSKGHSVARMIILINYNQLKKVQKNRLSTLHNKYPPPCQGVNFQISNFGWPIGPKKVICQTNFDITSFFSDFWDFEIFSYFANFTLTKDC